MAALVRLTHGFVDLREPDTYCDICSQRIEIDGLIYSAEKTRKVFHKTCVFYQITRGDKEVSPIVSDLPFSLYPLFPKFKIICSDTNSRRDLMAKQVAEAYGFFFRERAHEPHFCSQWEYLGVRTEKLSENQGYPSEEKIDLFVSILSDKLTRALEDPHSGECVGLQVIYRPKESSLLSSALRSCRIDLDRYPSFLPWNSQVFFKRNSKKIIVEADFQSSDSVSSCSEIELE